MFQTEIFSLYDIEFNALTFILAIVMIITIYPQAGNIFGASGLGGQVGYADPNFHIGYGFVSRYMSPMGIQMYDPRFKRLKDSIVRAIKTLQERP